MVILLKKYLFANFPLTKLFTNKFNNTSKLLKFFLIIMYYKDYQTKFYWEKIIEKKNRFLVLNFNVTFLFRAM